MLPQRPAGAPPPRPAGRPPGSPPGPPPGKPPGPPPGPPPGSPSVAAPAKPPPKGPPPVITPAPAPSTSPTSAVSSAAEAKFANPPLSSPSKKDPPPPRVAAPHTPPPEDETKPPTIEGKATVAGHLSSKTPRGQAPTVPGRAKPQGAPPARPLSGSAPPAPTRPPPGAPPRVPTGSPTVTSYPRGPPPRGPPPNNRPGSPLLGKKAEDPPRTPPTEPRTSGRPSGAPPGPPRGPPPSGKRSLPAEAFEHVQGRDQGEDGVAVHEGEERVHSVEEGDTSGNSGGINENLRVDAVSLEGSGGRVSPTSAKKVRTTPPAPKSPPGVPAGMVPPRTPPQRDRTPGVAPASTRSQEVQGGNDRIGENTAGQPSSTPPLKEEAVASPANARAASPPGDPGRRRPPPGTPPGRAPPSSAPPRARPAPPPTDELALLMAKEEEMLVEDDVVDDDEVPPPPQGLPPPEDLGGDDDGDSEDDMPEGQMVLVVEEEQIDGGHGGGRTTMELEVVRRGRFTARCISGGDVRKSTLSDKTTTVDAYLRLTLGKHKRAPTKRSKVVKRSGLSPDFESELMTFDIVEPKEFIIGGDVLLSVEIWDDSAWSDDLLASVELSALRFMHPDTVPNAEWFPLEAPSGRIKDRMKVQVELFFEPALVGMYVLTLYEGKGLGGNDPAARPNPYVVATLGEMYQKRSRVAKGGGSSPLFREEEIVMWIDKENWTHDLDLQVRSEDIGTDDELGSARLSVLQAMGIPPNQGAEKKIELFLAGKPSGQLFVKSTFLPSGTLKVTCVAGRSLRVTSAAGRMDPFVVFKTDGQAVALSRKTKVDKDGGIDPRWGETMKFDIVDQYMLWVECINHDMMETDEVVGVAQCSLLPAFKRGVMDTWIQLTTSSGPGPPKPAGEIHCTFDFEGPVGVAYPQHQPGIDSFDDSLRVNLKGFLEEDDGEKQNIETKEKEDGDTDAAIVKYQEPPQRSSEFSDEEISSAFKFLDLDHNLHIGAAEIRHILICMGELITDEEVDMMISMVDGDGDGQVSLEEFHRLIIDPDPSRPDFGNEPTKVDRTTAAAVTQETKDRESKRWLLDDFVKENEIRSVELELAYKRFTNLAPTRGVGGGGGQSTEVDFNTWILIFNVEATGQYRKLFKLYDVTGATSGTGLEVDTERIDIREFFLGMANFVEWSLEQRTQFIFTLFDDDRSGFLSMEELVSVLKANHLSTTKAVAKKAQTIMRQADADGSGSLTLDEFLVVAKKFPNLLFPPNRKGKDSQEAKVASLGNG